MPGRLRRLPQSVQEELSQLGNVVGAFSQGRDFDRDDVEAVEEVGSEAAGLYFFCQVAIRRGDDSQVDGDLKQSAEALDFVFLKRTEELDLDLGGQFADFIEEKRAAGREFDEAHLRADLRP